MFHHSLSHVVPRRVLFHWALMSFLSGSVNVGGFLACNRFVTHMTGFATLFGMHAGEGRWDAAAGIISIPVFFLLGVMISAWLVDRPKTGGATPHYAWVMCLVTACLCAAALFGHFHFFGEFGEEIRLKRDYFFLALLCMGSGLLNAAITTASVGTVRSTHLTGPITDLGIGMVRAMRESDSAAGSSRAEAEWMLARFRVGCVGAFALGAAVGAVTYMKWGYLGFLLPTALALYMALYEARTSVKSASKQSR